MIFLLSFLWFIREIKVILFWLYFWQLKEYHIGRFIDHFRTEKGKKIFFNYTLLLKIILVFIFLRFLFEPLPPCQKYFSNLFLSYFLIILYFFESVKGFSDFFKKKLKTPAFTKKIISLIFLSFLLQIFYFSSVFQKESFSFSLLIFDILTPAIISGIVLVFQPLSALFRYQIIRKAKKKRQEFKNLIVIGVTGSYGKTSTKEFLATILSEKFKVLKTKTHQNSEVGISQCILNELNENHEIFIVEMGAYNRGGIKLLCDIAKPKIGIVTGVNEQHLATFGSMENLLSAEGGIELIDSLPTDGIAFFNAKNKYCLELYQKTKIKKFLYGENATFPGQENILGAMMIAKILGMTDEEISRGAEKIKEKFPGIEIKKGKNGLNIIDATYSANPDGVLAHLEHLKTFTGKKVIIMPCLIELGSASKEIHKKIGEKIGQICDLAIITTKDKFKEIKEGATLSVAKPPLSGGAIKAGMPNENIIFLENPKEISEKIKFFCQMSDIILLEGRVSKEIIEFLSH